MPNTISLDTGIPGPYLVRVYNVSMGFLAQESRVQVGNDPYEFALPEDVSDYLITLDPASNGDYGDMAVSSRGGYCVGDEATVEDTRDGYAIGAFASTRRCLVFASPSTGFQGMIFYDYF